MLSINFLRRHLPKIIAALVLTFVSGVVDVAGYLGIYHFFTAHLTGTTVQLGRGIVDRTRAPVFAALAIVAAFVAGSVLGRALIEAASRRKYRRVASLTLAIEALLLAAVGTSYAGLHASPYSELALLAAAMGLQTATLTGIGPLTVHTTFVTGMVNKSAQLIARIGFRMYDHWRSGSVNAEARKSQEKETQMLALLASVWLFYAGGAAAGTWAFLRWEMRVLLFAIVLLGIVVATDQFWPLSIEEEKEQSER
jgi:uncharacterized membrane protein YoaK (UPF0700 family)